MATLSLDPSDLEPKKTAGIPSPKMTEILGKT
jgi:hypothetical protein